LPVEVAVHHPQSHERQDFTAQAVRCCSVRGF